MLTQKDLDQIEEILDERLEEKLNEKLGRLPSKEEFYEKMDEAMGELKAIRDASEIITGRVSDHGERITKLEDVHPH